MGLDITAYKSVRRVGDTVDDYDDFDRFTNLYINPDWPERADGMLDGHYEIDGEALPFRAGSYSGYNEWRNNLARAMHGVNADLIWRGRDVYRGAAFYELIDFADNEGIIGPRTSAKLADDFDKYLEQARVFAATLPSDESEWWMGRYELWGRAFRLAASEGGCVEFH